MIITCTECKKKFVVPDNAIPAGGRTVQCSACSNEWRQFPVKKTKDVVKSAPIATKKTVAPIKKKIAKKNVITKNQKQKNISSSSKNLNNKKNKSPLKEITLTTNGTLLGNLAKDLKQNGIDRINVSLDTIDPIKYNKITRFGNIQKVIDVLDNSDGCKVFDERKDGGYITPVEAEGKNETFISRIRKDNSNKKAINLWCVSDLSLIHISEPTRLLSIGD